MALPYYNRAAPFWDWVADFENGATQPHGSDNRFHGEGPAAPWNWRGPWARGFHYHHPHAPPTHQAELAHEHEEAREGEEVPPYDEREATLGAEENMNEKHEENEAGPSKKEEGKRREGCQGRSRDGPHMHGRGGCGGRGRMHGRGGGPGGWRRGPPGAGPFGPWNMRHMGHMAEQLFGGAQDAEGNRSRTNDDGVETFVPPVDVFDTVEAFVVHVSLAGAKKEDVAVSWNAEKSELSISGVVHRPGDEELLRTLALDERKAGMFERKVRLGSRITPAKVDADGITAKLEDGVLRVEVPKEDGDLQIVRKVDVE